MKAALRVLFRVFLIIGGVLAFLVIAAIGLFWFSVPDMCGNEILAEFPSPQGNRKVVVFQRDCGATTGFSTHASILGIAQVLKNESGNVLTSDTDHGAAPSGPGGGPALVVAWQSESSVQLSVHPKARVIKRESKVGGIHVSYVFSENGAQQGAVGAAPKTARP
jgi:hypothetical protein